MKDYGIAVALTFFLGGVGAHKFYLNKTMLGILYVLFCWTFVPLIISLLECLILLFMGKNKFDKKYN